MPAVCHYPEHIRSYSLHAFLVAVALLVSGCAAPGNNTDGRGDAAVHATCDFEYPDGTAVSCNDNNTVETRLAAGELQWGCIRHEPDFFVLYIDRLAGRGILELTLDEEGGNWVVFTLQQRANADAPTNTAQIAFKTAPGAEPVPINMSLDGELRIIAEAYSLNVSNGQPVDWRPLWSVYLPNGTDGGDVPENWLIVAAMLDGNRTVYVDPMSETQALAPREGLFHTPQDTNVTFAGSDVRLQVETLASYTEVVWDATAETHFSCRPA